MLGTINWPILVSLLVGSLPGVLLGGHVSIKVPDMVLRISLATILVVVGGRLVM